MNTWTTTTQAMATTSITTTRRMEGAAITMGEMPVRMTMDTYLTSLKQEIDLLMPPRTTTQPRIPLTTRSVSKDTTLNKSINMMKMVGAMATTWQMLEHSRCSSAWSDATLWLLELRKRQNTTLNLFGITLSSQMSPCFHSSLWGCLARTLCMLHAWSLWRGTLPTRESRTIISLYPLLILRLELTLVLWRKCDWLWS